MSVAKTIDGGSTWTRYSLTASGGYTYALAIDPSNSNIVYAGGDPGLYKTTNGGGDWINISSGLSGYVYTITIDCNNTDIVFAGTPNGVFKSTDGGNNWTNTGCSNVTSIVIDPNDSDTVYAGTNNGVYKSTIGGGSWSQMNDGLESINVSCLGIYPNYYLFTSTNDAGMYRWPFGNPGIEEDENLNKTFVVAQPNPTRGRVKLSYQLTMATPVKLTIYDVQGRLIKIIINEPQKPGLHTVLWNGLDDKNRPVAAGIYFFKLSTEEGVFNQKLIFLK